MSDYLCNLIIPGAAKSGTSSLCAMLNQHPAICMSKPKEPQFFSFDERFAQGAALHNQFYDHCSGRTRYYGDGSQCYFTHEWAIDRISRSIEHPKIVIMLRHPVERATSQYEWNVRRGMETKSFDAAIDGGGEERSYDYVEQAGVYDAAGGYLAFSRYSRWLPLWRNAFGPENVLVLKFDDFASSPEALVSHCFAFLGVEPFSPHPETRNATNAALRSPPLLKFIGKAVPNRVKTTRLYKVALRLLLEPITPKPQLIPAEARARLEQKLREEVELFEDRNSVLWQS